MASSFRTFQSSGLKFMSDIHRVCFYAKVWRTPTGLAFPSSTFYYRNAFDFYAQGCLNNGNHSALALPRVEKSSASKSLTGLWNLVNVLSFHIMKRKKKKKAQKAAATSLRLNPNRRHSSTHCETQSSPFPSIPHSSAERVFPHLNSYIWDDFSKGPMHLHLLFYEK